MYRVLIIDDEEPVREAIKILGAWKELKVNEIVEAYNGKEGLKSVRDIQPDIILMDMKMPEMSGPELLKILKLEYPEIQMIVISGYDSFDFARQAIKSNVTDYLLKPVNKEELNNALSKCINRITERRQEQCERLGNNSILNVSLPIMKAKLLMAIIEGKLDNSDKALYLKTFDTNGDNKRFAIAVLRVMNIEELVTDRRDGDTEQIYSEIIGIINETHIREVDCFSFTNPKQNREIIIMLSDGCTSSMENDDALPGVIKRILQTVKLKLRVKTVTCIGACCHGIEAIGDSYKSSKTVLHSINVIDIKEGAYTEAFKRRGILGSSILGSMSLIKNAFEKGCHNYLRDIISEYLNKIRASGYYSFKDAQKTINEFIMLMEDMTVSIGVPDNSILEEKRKRAIGISSNFITFEEFEDILLNIGDIYYLEVRKGIKANENFNVVEIKEYIDKNYSQEIKISIFTDKYYLSREYIMKLFKREYGCGIHEYIQRVRMKKAKELLNDVQIKIQSISQILGYSDTNYFSKAFKNYYGISPTDYRSNKLGV